VQANAGDECCLATADRNDGGQGLNEHFTVKRHKLVENGTCYLSVASVSSVGLLDKLPNILNGK